MWRMVMVVAVLYALCCAMALGQSTPSQTSAPTKPAGREKPAPAPADAPPNMNELMQRNGGSLLRASLAAAASDPTRPQGTAAGYLAVPEPEPRTLKKHDLVTIIVREESDYSSKGTSDLKKDASLDAGVDEFVKLNLKNWEIQGNAIGPNPPSVKMSGSRTMKGEATVDRIDVLTTRITAEVLDVKPNGTLVLQARKRIKTDDEEQELILTGVARAADVSVDNTVLSTQMHDLALTKNHRGAVKDTTQRGWLTKLLDALNPF